MTKSFLRVLMKWIVLFMQFVQFQRMIVIQSFSKDIKRILYKVLSYLNTLLKMEKKLFSYHLEGQFMEIQAMYQYLKTKLQNRLVIMVY